MKNPPANAGDMGLIPRSRRSPGGGNGNPLQYSCLGNPMDKEPGGLQSMGFQRVSLMTKQQHAQRSCRQAPPAESHYLPVCSSDCTAKGDTPIINTDRRNMAPRNFWRTQGGETASPAPKTLEEETDGAGDHQAPPTPKEGTPGGWSWAGSWSVHLTTETF